MAKKSGFTLAAAVKDAVAANPDLSGPEIYDLLSKKQSGINKNSLGVAFSQARKALGIGGKRARKRRAKGKPVTKRVAKPQNDRVSISSLMAAKQFLQSTGGDLDEAIRLLKQINDLRR